MASENGRETPDRVGGLNYDGSVDYGCFQINDKAHPQFFATQDWRNPVASAQYAYNHIFVGRGDFSAWYAVCPIDKVTKKQYPSKPGIWCN